DLWNQKQFDEPQTNICDRRLGNWRNQHLSRGDTSTQGLVSTVFLRHRGNAIRKDVPRRTHHATEFSRKLPGFTGSRRRTLWLQCRQHCHPLLEKKRTARRRHHSLRYRCRVKSATAETRADWRKTHRLVRRVSTSIV